MTSYKVSKSLINKPNAGLGSIKNLIVGFVGLMLADCIIGLRYLYEHTLYVRDRLSYEAKINFDRNEVNELYDEYPFSKDGIMATDVMIRNQIN